MDEPFTGLDPINLVLLREAFMELRDQGRTLIFSTHQMEAAEAMCESVAIVDRGRLVAGGPLRALKRASGRQRIRLTVEGENPAPVWLSDLPGVDVVRRDATGAELELLPTGQPAATLADLLGRGETVRRFEVVEPSLEALFIELVGRPPDDEPTIAVAPTQSAGAAAPSAAAGDLA
jgi:ABC-2 type transport system ATP-binding protein